GFNGNLGGLVLFTSGSTGAPQAIPKKLFQLSREVATLEAQFGQLLGSSEIIATVSHQHLYGLLFNVLWPLTAGRAIHAREYYFPQQLIAAPAGGGGAIGAIPPPPKRFPQKTPLPTATQAIRAGVFSLGAAPVRVG